MDFNKELEKRVEYISEVLDKYLVRNDTDLQKIIYEAMNYSVLAGGKRLRPMFILETSRLFKGDDKICEPFMACIEMIHTYSLIHDDLPAMDNDDYRRGRLTTHKKFGEDIGILAGDALLNFAFETGLKGIIASGYDKKCVDALEYISEKSGVYGMVGGQVVDVINDGKDKNIELLDYINELKTGALIEASMVSGAMLAGANETEIQVVEQAASNIGRAFQIQDDILDVTSTTEELGKPVKSDEKNNKSTYVNLMGIENAKKEVEKLTESAMIGLKSLNLENDFLFELINSLIYRKK